MRRRALLAALGATAAAGCLSGGPAPSARTDTPPSDGTDTPPSDVTETSPGDATDTPSGDATDTRDPLAGLPAGPVRCRGDPVSVERTLRDREGYADDFEYYPGNATVRFVEARRGEEPVSFDTMAFERWASLESAEVGLRRVRAATSERLGTDDFGSGTGQPPEGFDGESLVVWLTLYTRLDDGEVVATPTVPLSRLADVAPRSVSVTVSVSGDSYSRTVPVFASHTTSARA